MKIKIIDIDKEFELFENCDFCDNRFAKYDEQFKDKICDICSNISCIHPEIIELKHYNEYKYMNKNL